MPRPGRSQAATRVIQGPIWKGGRARHFRWVTDPIVEGDFGGVFPQAPEPAGGNAVPLQTDLHKWRAPHRAKFALDPKVWYGVGGAEASRHSISLVIPTCPYLFAQARTALLNK